MTEYILLVGLVAILMIGGVAWYGFRAREAVEGTTDAMNRGVGRPMEGPAPEGTSDRPTRTVTDSAGHKWDVYDTGGNRQIVTPANTPPTGSSPTYDPRTHGS